MRQMPAVPSATHKWRTGWLVAELSAVPYRMMPPLGAVIELCALGVPAICAVEVVGDTVD